MRFTTTSRFGGLVQAHADAFVTFNAVAAADTPDTPEYEAAEEAETKALTAVLTEPATTATEVATKLDLIDRFEASGREDYPHYAAQLQRDLKAMTRPNVSAKVAAAFALWAKTWEASCDEYADEQEGKPLSIIFLGADARADESTALTALHAVPCTTPGDFIVKAFADLLDECGPPADGHTPFEPDASDPCDDPVRHGAREARVRDILDCDLGQCLVYLGSTEFSAAAYVRLASRAGGMPVIVAVSANGRRSLSIATMAGSEMSGDTTPRSPVRRGRYDALLRLTAFDSERVNLIIDEIEARHPHLVLIAPKEEPEPKPVSALADELHEAAVLYRSHLPAVEPGLYKLSDLPAAPEENPGTDALRAIGERLAAQGRMSEVYDAAVERYGHEGVRGVSNAWDGIGGWAS